MGMPLTTLSCQSTRVSDLTPLRGMRLENVSLSPTHIAKGIEVLRQMKTIRSINRMRPAEFWRKYDAGEFK